MDNDSSNSVADLCLEVAQTVLPEFLLAVRIMVFKKTTQHKKDRNVIEKKHDKYNPPPERSEGGGGIENTGS